LGQKRCEEEDSLCFLESPPIDKTGY